MTPAKRSKKKAASESPPIRRRWRDYKTPSGRSPVEEFIDKLSDSDAAAVLVAEEGSRGQILLALDGFKKKTQKTPPATIELAKRRLADWRRRGDQKRVARGRRPLHQ